MLVEHLAVDGSVVTVEADADLSTDSTATGWAIAPWLMQAHPFTVHPPGHSFLVENAVRTNFGDVDIASADEYTLKGGTLRVVEVRMATATGAEKAVTVGAWEGEHGCLATSLLGSDREGLTELFDSLPFSEHRLGVAIDAPVVSRPRPPEVAKEIPGIGVLAIRPAIRSEMERVPRQQGMPVRNGELFRIRQAHRALLYVSQSAVASIDPPDEPLDEERLAYTIEGLRVTWKPRRGTAS